MGWRASRMTAAVVTVGALVACGDVGGGKNSGDQSLTTMGFGLPDEIATVRVDAFQKVYPGVKLTINQGHDLVLVAGAQEPQELGHVLVHQSQRVRQLLSGQDGS